MTIRIGIAALLGSVSTLGVGCATGQKASVPSASSQPSPPCYIGPVELHVTDPDGRPAADVQVGLFGATWLSEDANRPPVHKPELRTDAHGRLRMKSIKECSAPTIFYACDEARQLAGFRLVGRLEELAHEQTVQLEAARWVTGRIASSEAQRRNALPKYVVCRLTPIPNAIDGDRALRYAMPPGQPFRFLVPPGKYRIFVYGLRLERRMVDIHVPPGSTALDLGTYDLLQSPPTR